MPDRWLQSLRGFLIYCRGLLSGLQENWTWRTLNLVCEAWELNTRRSVSPQTSVNSVVSILRVCPFGDLFIVFSTDWLRFFCWVNSKSHQWRCKITGALVFFVAAPRCHWLLRDESQRFTTTSPKCQWYKPIRFQVELRGSLAELWAGPQQTVPFNISSFSQWSDFSL